jgi:hypothetical protein
MSKRNILPVLFALITLGGLAILVGCSGGTSNDPTNSDYEGSEFVATDSSVGSITLDVLQTTLGVGEVSGFMVTVRNSNGAPVENIQVACDTEKGLALIEPTTGRELTNSNGQMSGKVGCEVPGSLIVGCRLPIGVNRRQFVTMKCEGPVPSGFTGFPGAAGGGLGSGGVSVPDDGGDAGGSGTSGIRMTSIETYDEGAMCSGAASVTIDVVQSVCSDSSSEPFYDSSVSLDVVNNSNVTVRFDYLRYSVSGSDGSGTVFTSSNIGLIGDLEISPNGGTKSFCAPFTRGGDGGKRFIGGSSLIPSSYGVRNITFTLYGSTETGDSVVISGTNSVYFNNYNRCSS